MFLRFLCTAAWLCHLRSPSGMQPSVCSAHITAAWDRHETLREEMSWCLPWSMVSWEPSCVVALHSSACCSRQSAPGERNGPRKLRKGQISDLPRGNAYRSCREHRGWRCDFSIWAWAAYGCPPTISVLMAELVGALILIRVVV